MQKSKIEWTDYTINPVKGLCPVACPFCYARRIYKRYKWDETIRWSPEQFIDMRSIKKPSRIFIGSTMELFGDWVRPEWLDCIFGEIQLFPQHTFIFLTKRPENLIKYSPFPKNVWVGATVTDFPSFAFATAELAPIEATVKFMSAEPLHASIGDGGVGVIEERLRIAGINWVIVGQQSPMCAKTAPKIEWVREIVEAVDNAQVPVFLKNNLYSVINHTGHWDKPFYTMVEGYGVAQRQEYPNVA